MDQPSRHRVASADGAHVVRGEALSTVPGDNRTTEQRLADALAQQDATSEVLRVMAGSPGEPRAVLQVIADQAARLCHAPFARVFLSDGKVMRVLAQFVAEGETVQEYQDVPLARTSISGRTVLDGATLHYADILPHLDAEFPEARENARRTGFRAILAVPLPSTPTAIGAIFLWRREPIAFTADQIALIETFARQAVIALANVRHLQAVTESLERQTATSDILRVISESPRDTRPVFETIAGAALRLCHAQSVVVVTYDGKLLTLGAVASVTPDGADAIRSLFPRPASRDNGITRAILTRELVVIPDVLEDREYTTAAPAVAAGFRSVLAIPLMREGAPIGAISLGRAEPGAFTDAHTDLLRTFADQAVIAIENVRLFNALERRNRDLAASLEQQTATSDILRVISRSNADVQPVFDLIVRSVRSLCGAAFSGVYRLEGDVLSLVAADGLAPEALARFSAGFPRKVGPDTVTGRAALECRVVQTADLVNDPLYAAAPGARVGARTVLGVPLMRGGQAIGSIGVWRSEVEPFTDTQIALLQTFADQAVIAIENVRLFGELRARTAELTKSVAELKALGDVGQAVSSSLDLETVLSTIVARATELTGMDGGSIYEYDEARGEFHLHTADRLPDELVATLRADPIRKGEGALGRMALAGEPVQIPDIVDESAYRSRVREALIRLGYRSLLAVPLMRDDRLLGGLAVNRKTSGPFGADVIALLKSFAAQSALAIQNARLFREIEVKGRELEQASRHKSEFLANMSHELRTPLNAIIGFSEVLAERMFGEINDKQAEYLGDILGSARHLLSLINDILDLSKVEAGRIELDLAAFDVAEAMDNALALVRERAQRRGIALRADVPRDLGSMVADARKFKQVLLNLLSNAIKFTPEGGTVGVRAGAVGDAVEVAVSDTGVGISAEDQALVFEEFRQVGAAHAKAEGTGLGLAISRRFVELHGGTIRVESAPGEGATFVFRLPRHPPQSA